MPVTVWISACCGYLAASCKSTGRAAERLPASYACTALARAEVSAELSVCELRPAAGWLAVGLRWPDSADEVHSRATVTAAVAMERAGITEEILLKRSCLREGNEKCHHASLALRIVALLRKSAAGADWLRLR